MQNDVESKDKAIVELEKLLNEMTHGKSRELISSIAEKSEKSKEQKKQNSKMKKKMLEL